MTPAAPQGEGSSAAASPLETVSRIASQVARVHADAVDREGRFPNRDDALPTLLALPALLGVDPG